MYTPEPDKPLQPTSRPASPYERQAAREAALVARIETLERLVEALKAIHLEGVSNLDGRLRELEMSMDEIMAALERAGIPRNP